MADNLDDVPHDDAHGEDESSSLDDSTSGPDNIFAGTPLEDIMNSLGPLLGTGGPGGVAGAADAAGIDFNAVLSSQRTRLSAQDSAAAARASLATDHVQLYKALGGGWEAEQHPPERLTALPPAPSGGGTTPAGGPSPSAAFAGMACAAAARVQCPDPS